MRPVLSRQCWPLKKDKQNLTRRSQPKCPKRILRQRPLRMMSLVWKTRQMKKPQRNSLKKMKSQRSKNSHRLFPSKLTARKFLSRWTSCKKAIQGLRTTPEKRSRLPKCASRSSKKRRQFGPSVDSTLNCWEHYKPSFSLQSRRSIWIVFITKTQSSGCGKKRFCGSDRKRHTLFRPSSSVLSS